MEWPGPRPLPYSTGLGYPRRQACGAL